MRVATSLAFATMLLGGSVEAEVITRCERPTGQTAALEKGAIVWETDGMSEGSVTIVRDAKGLYDAEIRSSYNAFTVRGDGASIYADPGPGAALTLVARYPMGTVETYVLALDASGSGTLIWSMMKNRVGGTTKGTLLTAPCRRP